MKCRKCKDKGKIKRAIIFLSHHNLALCRECFVEWYEKKLRQTIKKMNMFSKKDKVLVAVSGGKDSLALWYALNKLGYRTEGVYIDLGIDIQSYSSLSREKAELLSSKIGRHLHIIEVKKELGAGIIKLNTLTKQSACSICGLVKRYFTNRLTLRGGYFCVATGHNLDDETATLLANTLSWDTDSLSRQMPVLPEKEGLARRVKPLIYFTEKENLLYCLLQKIDYIADECPLSARTGSIFYKKILNSIEERSPGTKLRFYFNFLKNMQPLLFSRVSPPLHPCPSCRQPTTAREKCAFCRLKEKIQPTLSGQAHPEAS